MTGRPSVYAHSIFILLISIGFLRGIGAQPVLQHLQGINYAEVIINDSFWSPKIRDVATGALEVCVYQTEEATPRIQNFTMAGAREGQHEGIYYDDSDVYKALEAIAYSLHSVPNAQLEAKADEWIDKIAAAQMEDGYLNTYFILQGLEQRWQDMEKHEAYCAGHLIEAAIAYYEATGKRKLLDVAIAFADHMDRELRQAGKPWVAGHQEIELALVKLYRATGEERYLQLSQWFLDQRGHGHGKGKIWDEWKDPGYCQDAVPVREQREITGHAVRAMYMYTGIADLAAITEDQAYMETMLRVYEDVVHRNTYLTGGIGSAGHNEGFDQDFVLPNEEAYCETCASVGMVFWNQRMNWLTGDARYVDVLERSLYNGALDGISLDGRQFFYPNPLASSGQHQRKDWFGTACCPSNISRLIASVGNYIYARSDDALWVNLFISNKTTQQFGDVEVEIDLSTAYPWDGNVRLTLVPEKPVETTLYLRIPGWTGEEALPGDLYRFLDRPDDSVVIRVDGEPVPYEIDQGYAVIRRKWSGIASVEMDLPMSPRMLKSRPEVEENRDHLALQYGPLVYCFEAVDNDGRVDNLLLVPHAKFEVNDAVIADEPVKVLTARLPVVTSSPYTGTAEVRTAVKTAIPYYTWCNRGSNAMRVWMPTQIEQIGAE